MTTEGFKTDIQIATLVLKGKLKIESAHGKLFSDFSLKNICYQDDLRIIQINSFKLSWNPTELLAHKRIIINNININIKIENTLIHIVGGFQKNWDAQWNVIIPKSSTISGKITGPFLAPHIQTNQLNLPRL